MAPTHDTVAKKQSQPVGNRQSLDSASPTQLVTFVFIEIANPAQLLKELGDAQREQCGQRRHPCAQALSQLQ